MVRRRRGNSRLRLFAVLAVVITIGAIVAIMVTPAGDLLVVASDEVKMLVNGWVIDSAFTFAITTPNNGVSCSIGHNLIFEYQIGNRVVVDTKNVFVPIITVFSVTAPQDELLEIVDIDLTGTIVCEPVGSSFSIDVVGGSVTYIWKTRNEAGTEVQIKRQDKAIPTFARNAINGVKLPSGSVFATEIENAVNLQTFRDKTVPITADVSYNILLKTSATGDLFNSGQITSQAGGTVKVVSETATPPPTPQGRNVDITTVIPSQVNFVGTATPSGNQIGEGDFITIRAIGILDDWQASEGNPFVNVKAPNGQILLINKVMTPTGTTGSISSFSTGNFQITNLAVRENNIAGFDGAWIVEMHSNNDVRGVVDSMNFALVDARTPDTTLPPTTCTINEEPDQMGGCKPKETTTVPTFTCPSISAMGLFVSSATSNELLDKKTELDELQSQGDTQQCVSNFLQLVNQEILIRGIETPPTTGVSSTKAFIEYLSAHAPKGTEQSGCTIPLSGTVGRIPTEGITVTGFQLIGMGAPCEGNTWQNTQLDIIIDFGEDVKEFVIDDTNFDLEHRLFISVNNPYDIPTFNCPANVNPSLLPNCTVKNHNFLNDKVGQVGLRFDQVAEINEFIDRDLGDPRLQLAHINLQNNLIKDAIQKDHILLDGDKVEVLYYTWGKFGGTFKGNPVNGVFLPMSYIQKFTWDNQGVQTKCPDGENLREDRECKPEGTDICELPNKRDVDDVCRSPPKTTNGVTTNGELICEASLKENQPVCTAEQSEVPTGVTDDCDIPFYECKAKSDPKVIEKPEPTVCTAPQVSDGMGGCIDKPADKIPKVNDMCPAMYLPDPNDSTMCKLIGSDLKGGDDEPKGDGSGASLCEKGDLGACFAEAIRKLQEGLPSFTFGTGIDPIIFVGIAIAVIALIAVGIIIRRRRGAGGF